MFHDVNSLSLPLVVVVDFKLLFYLFRFFNGFLQPYEGDPGNYGLQVIDFDSLLNRTLESDKFGLQVDIFLGPFLFDIPSVLKFNYHHSRNLK